MVLLKPTALQACQPVSLRAFHPIQQKRAHTLLHGHLANAHHRNPPSRVVIAKSYNRDNSPITEYVNQVVPGKDELLSLKLDPEVRKRAEAGISRLRNKATVGDLAAATGLTISQSESALRSLASDSLATLQVADDGEIVYIFPSNFKESIQAKSLWLRLEPAGGAIAQGAAYLGRIAFGTALITSVVAVTLALTVVASSGQSDRDRRGGGGYGGGPRIWFNMTDLLWYWDPFYYRRRQSIAFSGGSPPPMNFLEAIFSVVFGDGNPNETYDANRWEAIGRYIQYRRGVVTAEELAPFLDLEPGRLKSSRKGTVVDESFVVPVLARFGGDPVPGPNGTILYQFPSLQQTTKTNSKRDIPRPAAIERTWALTTATNAQQLGVWALGLVNFVGVTALGFALQNPSNLYALTRSGMGWITGSMPLLQAYAAAFFVVPIARWILNKGRNAAIENRNFSREQALQLLQRPDETLQLKLNAAQNLAEQRVVTERDVVFRTDKDVEQQPVDIEGDAWERRLERRASQREQPSTQQRGWFR